MYIKYTPVKFLYLRVTDTCWPVYARAMFRRRRTDHYCFYEIQWDESLMGNDAPQTFPGIMAHEEGHIMLHHHFTQMGHKLKEIEADIYAISKVGFDVYFHELVGLSIKSNEFYTDEIIKRSTATNNTKVLSQLEYEMCDQTYTIDNVHDRFKSRKSELGDLTQDRAKHYVDCRLENMQ